MTPFYYFKDSELLKVKAVTAGKTHVSQVVDHHWYPGWICIDRGYDENCCLSTALIMMPNRAVLRVESDERGIVNAHELIEGDAAKALVLAAGYPEPEKRASKGPSETQKKLSAQRAREYQELQRKSQQRLAEVAAKQGDKNQ